MPTLLPRLLDPDDAEALRVDGEALSYRALRARVEAHLLRLAALGVRAGERVGVFTHGTLEVAAAMVAQVTHGVVTVPLNPGLGERELAHVLRDAAPRYVFVDATRRGELGERERVDGLAERLHELGTSDVAVAGARPVPDEQAAPRLCAQEVSGEVALILYTSGTTGAPKGAQLSSANLAANLDALAATWGWTGEDTVVHALPLFHVHGLVLGLLGALRVGGALHHVSRFSPESLSEALAGVAPGRALLFAVPTMYHRLIDAAEAERDAGGSATPIADALRHARLLVSGSAGLSTREHRRIEALTGRGVHERYGLTETLINCGVPASDPPRPGYVGPALPGVALRRVDEQRRPLPPEANDDSTLGEIAVRGASVFLGYLNCPDATHEVLDEDGWFYTGDLATQSADGAVRIVGRRSTDLIKTGGYKVGAGEIEAALLEHPGVAEVAALGVPDEDLGERIVAFVVPRAGAAVDDETLRAHVAGLLTRYKQPREYRFVAALPRNAMGKVQKKRLLPDVSSAASPVSAASPASAPPEVRVDRFTGYPVIVASVRAQIRHGRDPGVGLPQPSGPCPFCPDNEERTEPAVLRVPADEALPWRVRFVPNRYPWVVDASLAAPFTPPVGGECAPALGVHDVIVEHPDHDLDLVDYDDEHLTLLLESLRDRMRTVESTPGVVSVSLFRNRGRRAGSSQPHPHAQLIGASVLGPIQEARRDRARAHHEREGTNILAAHVAAERAAQARVLLDDGAWFASCPFAPRHPYEVLLAPVPPTSTSAPLPFSELDKQALRTLGGHLRALVRAALSASHKTDYNLVWHQLPVAEREAAHAYWAVEIAPRGGGGAGFELTTGLAMSSTPPEVTAARIRDALRNPMTP
ncbi:MAG: AMP-binding protein [Myxococcales bacterium]|nr:AMP-binding protein [Myxococcales bacterium]